MAQDTALGATVEVLRRHGVSAVFGNPGTTELPLLARLPDDLAYVLCLHESIAVAAATGHALAGGRTAVVNLHARPGLGHAIGALDGAGQVRAPLVVIVGQQHSGHLRRDPLLAGDLVDLARPVARWVAQPTRAADVPHAVERAFRVAETAPQGPAVVVVPMDHWDQPAMRPPVAVMDPQVDPLPTAVQRLRVRLARARSAVLVTGDGLRRDADWAAAVAVAEAWGLPVHAAPIGLHTGFPTDHPSFCGHLPLTASGTRAVLDRHDLVLVAGAPAFTMYLHDGTEPTGPDTDVVALSDDVGHVAGAPAVEVVLGSPGRTLAALAAVSGGRPSSSGAAEGSDASPAAEPAGRDVNPAEGPLAVVAAALAAALPEDAVVVDESMTSGPTIRRAVTVRRPGAWLRTANGVLGTGLPAAVGATTVPGTGPVVAVVGDGAALFAPQALWTAAQLGADLTVVVLDNGGYESLRGAVAAVTPDVALDGRWDLPGVDLVAVAEGLGVPAVRTSVDAGLGGALARALGSGGPSLLVVDL